MNEYRLVKYDYDSSDELAKAFILNFINEHLSEIKSSKDDTVEQIMYEISQYGVRIFIVYDGGHPFGIVACSTRTFYYHQILRFIYLESKFQTTEVYNSVFDTLIQITGYKGLAIISKIPIAEEYINSGFFQVDYKNPEKSLVYLRTRDITDKTNREEYIRKHIKYMKNFKLLYGSFFYIVFLFALSSIFTLLFVFNSSVSSFVKMPLIIISIGLFASIFVSRYLLKKYNVKGEAAFGFQYNMTYINLFQYKFKSKTKELFSSFIQALIDAGV
ncbi:MAG: hypothetical protein KKH01_05880 [Firmicutes bacterium]|nr:hypothetical protein [Bacillota bacterium]